MTPTMVDHDRAHEGDADADPGDPGFDDPADGAESHRPPSPPARVRWLRWTATVAIVLALALVATLATAVVVVRRSWPQTGGELTLSGLDGEVRVVRDGHGIPQIYADTTHDLMLAQGFVHAQDRFFQMDVRRHATAGRLAELFGESALESDVVVRTLGWRAVAEQELALLRPATRSALDAYAKGVNAYLEGRSTSEMALEYTVLGVGGLDYQPERWTAVDSVAWLKAMAWDLRTNLEEEIGRAIATAQLGPGRTADLYPGPGEVERTPVLEQAAPALARVGELLAGVPALLGAGDGLGSNAWAVAGERTASGAPILANDPHLGVGLPGVWTQVGLHCRTVSEECPYDVAGFGFAGVPGVVIGHNRDIAWGFTNLGADVTDLYVERVSGDTWEYGGRRLPLTERAETIEVRGAEDVELRVRATAHGPLVSDLARFADADGIRITRDGLLAQLADVGDTRPPGEQALSLAWTALTPRPTADALLALGRAHDWRSFRKALADFAVPGQNVVYADVEGHVGYQATGLVPVRGPGNDGRLPAPGWLPEAAWTGEFVPYDALPSALDPEDGIVVSANQAVTARPGPGTPYLTSDWDLGFRAARIDRLLAADDELTVEAMTAIQLDDRSAIGEALTPYLLDVELPGGYYSDGQRLLRSWNYQQDADSAAAAYFNAVWRHVLELTFADELPPAIRPDGGDRWFAVVSALLPRGRSPWWDDVRTDDKVERRSDILREAMIAARDEMTALQSPSADEWSWGRLHELELRSPTLGESGIGIVERIFNRDGWEVGGGSSLVNATGWDARHGYRVATVPSMRMVVPLDDLDAARWISLTGVSGHAFHPHYTDQTDLWARGESLPWVFSEKAVTAAAEDTLLLTPSR